MGDRADGAAGGTRLRRKAELRLEAQKKTDLQLSDTLKIVHELQVHQIELEMQNEALQHAQDELRLSRDRYSRLYDFAPVGYLTLDRSGAIRTANLAGADLLGVVRSRLIRRHIGDFITETCLSRFGDFLRQAFTSQEAQKTELTLKSGSGRPLYVQVEAAVIEGGDECLAALVDITDRKLAETALRVARDELEQRVVERTAELVVAASRQQEEMAGRLHAMEELRKRELLMIHQNRMAAMGEMIANIAHQWRQPLNVIGLLAQHTGYFNKQGLLTGEKLDENMTKIQDILRFLSQTIDDFRDFTLPDKQKRPFRVNHVVEKTLHLVEDLFKKERIDINTDSCGESQINGVPNEFGQVLLILLMNAQDAFIESGVDDRRISVRNWTENGRTIVTVADNAGGIGEDIKEKIFDAYFTTKGEEKGSGVGLYMAKTIIEKNMGGRLSVRNVDGGAEFRIEV